jgi:hypothetical protein
MLAIHPCTFRGFIVLAALLAATASVAEALGGGRILEDLVDCNFCGDGVVTIRQGVFQMKGNELKCVASPRQAPKDKCGMIQAVAFEPCGCTGPPPSSVTTASSKIGSPSAGKGSSKVGNDLPHCSICGDGEITIPDGLLSVKGKSARCDVAEANPKGTPQEICQQIQAMARVHCGCTGTSPSSSSATAAASSQMGTPAGKGSSAGSKVGKDLPHCSICGDGEITIPDGELSLKGKSARCDFLEANPKGTPVEICQQVQAMAREPCGCTGIPPSSATTAASSQMGTSSAGKGSSAGSKFGKDLPHCSICGDDKITIPDGELSIKGKSARCDFLEATRNGTPVEICQQVQAMAREPCGCAAKWNPKPSTRSNPSSSTSSVGTTSISSNETVPEAADSEQNHFWAFVIISVCGLCSLFIYTEYYASDQSSQGKSIKDGDELAVQDTKKSSYRDEDDNMNESSFRDEEDGLPSIRAGW